MKTVVVNKRHEICDVYVGRGSPWGNPFSHVASSYSLVTYVATREEAIAKYREWIQTQPQLLARLPELRGRILGCWCLPVGGSGGKIICHAQILAAMADEIID